MGNLCPLEGMVMFWKDKKVLITGHTGFKGSWLTMWLQMLGAKVYGISDKKIFFNVLQEPESTIHDIRDAQFLGMYVNNIKPDIVFHLAAQPLVIDSYNDPVNTLTTNINGTINLLESLRKNKPKAIVMVTTDKVYQNNEWEWSYRENEKLGGHDPYSASKACSEIISASYRSSFDLNLATARAGNVIGGGDISENRLVPDVLSRKPIDIRSPNSIRPWQHVLEPLAGYINLAEKLYESSVYADAWNFGPYEQDARPVGWIVDKLQSMLNTNHCTIHEDNTYHEAKYLKLDISKSCTFLGWKPKWDLEKALFMIARWDDQYRKGRDALDISKIQIEEYMND